MKKLIISIGAVILILVVFLIFNKSKKENLGNFDLVVNTIGVDKEITHAILSYKKEGMNVVDSLKVINNKVSFTGAIYEAMRAKLSFVLKNGELSVDGKNQIPGFPKKKKNQFYFFLEAGDNHIDLLEPLLFSEVVNFSAQEDYLSLSNELGPLDTKKESSYIEYVKLAKVNDSMGIAKVTSDIIKVDKLKKEVYKNFILSNPESKIVGYALNRYGSTSKNVKSIQPLLDVLSEDLKNSYSIQALLKVLAIKERVAIDSEITDFKLPNPKDETIAMSSFRGKYVLVDFWASWCGPCRGENPNLVKAYHTYKESSFTILSVSFDRKPADKQKWIKAIEKDGLVWTNVSDLKGFDSPIATLFGITSLPYNLLISPEGIIIDKNLRGKALDERLSELFKIE